MGLVQAFLFANSILRLNLIVAKNKVIEGFRSCTIMNCRLNCLKKENCIDETGSKTNKKISYFLLRVKNLGGSRFFKQPLLWFRGREIFRVRFDLLTKQKEKKEKWAHEDSSVREHSKENQM